MLEISNANLLICPLLAAGPHVEVELWRVRMTKLNSVMEQLQVCQSIPEPGGRHGGNGVSSPQPSQASS